MPAASASTGTCATEQPQQLLLQRRAGSLAAATAASTLALGATASAACICCGLAILLLLHARCRCVVVGEKGLQRLPRHRRQLAQQRPATAAATCLQLRAQR